MPDYLDGIDKLLGEHEQLCTKIGGCNRTINELSGAIQNWIPGRSENIEQELSRLDKLLQEISKELEEHIREEEHEFLPVLTAHAADIIRRGVLYEHQAILESISDLKKHVKDFAGKPADREEMLEKQSKVKESIGRILEAVEEHAHTQEVVFNLARESTAE
jgi:DNA repair exonuclease SbcCD ATPase subunit